MSLFKTSIPFVVLTLVLLVPACTQESAIMNDAAGNADGANDKQNEISVTPLVWTGTVRIAQPGFRRYLFPDNGPEIDIDNGVSRDGNSFFDIVTGFDQTTECDSTCEGCHFNFVMELDIEAAPGGDYESDDDGFFDAWHGDNVNDRITWTENGGGNSGWFNGNDPNNFGHTSIARYKVDQWVRCGGEASITISASSSTGDVTPVSVSITLKCNQCPN